MFCDQRLQLLDQWMKLAVEYSLTVISAMKAKSQTERLLFVAVMEDAKKQTQSAHHELDEHRQRHGC